MTGKLLGMESFFVSNDFNFSRFMHEWSEELLLCQVTRYVVLNGNNRCVLTYLSNLHLEEKVWIFLYFLCFPITFEVLI